MKLVIQIPCYNEETTLPLVIKDIPRKIQGIDEIAIVVIDDGSTDGTSRVAKDLNVDYIVRNTRNLGLAYSFRKGVDAALALGADIIVNLDGDNQYNAQDIPKLVAPIIAGEADLVLGNRNTQAIAHFSPTKKLLQRFGTFIVRRLSHTPVKDAVTGFRAFSKSAALRLTILSNFTYTIETILQVGPKGLALKEVEIRTNPVTRDSRLAKSIWSFVTFSAATIIRIFSMYNPLNLFLRVGGVLILIGSLLALRFLYFYINGAGTGLIQSLIFAAVALISGVTVILFGLLADLIQFNRRLLEDILERIRRLELQSPKRD